MEGYCTHISLIVMQAKWEKNVLDTEENISAMFIDIPKAFDTKNHSFLLSKLQAYGFSKQTLRFRCSYLNNRRQRVQINNKFSSLKELITGVPQGSIDEPIIFNLFINDIFLFLCLSILSN